MHRNSAAFTPESPGIAAFVAYGAKQTFENQGVNDPRTGPLFWATSSGALLGYGAAFTGLSTAAGAYLGAPTAVVKALFPFATRLALGGTGVGTSTATAATGGGIAGVLAATISTLITASMSLAKELAIPDQLQALINGTDTYPVESILRNCSDTVVCFTAGNSDLQTSLHQELFAVFQLTTRPDYAGSEPAPAAQPGDSRRVVAGSSVDWLQYEAEDGSPRAVRLSSGPWLADRADSAGEGRARLTLSISYKSADGATWAARRIANQFLIARSGIPPTAYDYPAPRQSTELSVLDLSGRTVTAQIAQ
ncbi:MAG: hypothetical protein ACR2IK_01740 [Chloroflexota bacterium]